MLTKNLTKERISNKFNKLGLNCNEYVNYILEHNLLNSKKGKCSHHIFPTSIFGDNKHTIRVSRKMHTRLHLLLVADNLDSIKEFNYSDNMSRICLASRIVQYNGTTNRFIFDDDLHFYQKYEKDIISFSGSFISDAMKKLWNSKEIYKDNLIFRDYMSKIMTEIMNSDEEYKDGLTRKEYLSKIMTEIMNSDEEYKDGLTRKEYISLCMEQLWQDSTFRKTMCKIRKNLWNDPEYVKKTMAHWSNPEWLKAWSVIDSTFMKKLWATKEYREYILKCREESGSYEKISKSKKKEWADLTEEEYNQRLENISKGVNNSPKKENMGAKTKDLWQDEDYREHMKLVHTKEYKIKHGTWKEDSEEMKYKYLLRSFRYSQKMLIKRLMNINDLTYSSLCENGGYTKLYNHRYLFKRCGLKFKFDKSLLNDKFLADFSDIKKEDFDYYSDIPFDKFKKQLIRLVKNTK